MRHQIGPIGCRWLTSPGPGRVVEFRRPCPVERQGASSARRSPTCSSADLSVIIRWNRVRLEPGIVNQILSVDAIWKCQQHYQETRGCKRPQQTASLYFRNAFRYGLPVTFHYQALPDISVKQPSYARFFGSQTREQPIASCAEISGKYKELINS